MDLYLIIWSEEEERFIRVPVPEGAKGMAFVDRQTKLQVDVTTSSHEQPMIVVNSRGFELGIKPIASNSITVEAIS